VKTLLIRLAFCRNPHRSNTASDKRRPFFVRSGRNPQDYFPFANLEWSPFKKHLLSQPLLTISPTSNFCSKVSDAQNSKKCLRVVYSLRLHQTDNKNLYPAFLAKQKRLYESNYFIRISSVLPWRTRKWSDALKSQIQHQVPLCRLPISDFVS